jgi:hypothetical protein
VIIIIALLCMIIHYDMGMLSVCTGSIRIHIIQMGSNTIFGNIRIKNICLKKV